jgi:hypothetical protein
VGAAILVLLGLRLGSEPFLRGLRHTDGAALLVALLVTAGTTACCARRWSLVAGELGVAVPFREALRAVYRAQVLNATLPTGVVGDVHRGYQHGRDSGAVSRGLWSVVWDRGSGQVVQAALAVAALPLLIGVRGGLALALPALVVVGIAAVLFIGGVWPEVALLSTVAALGHVGVFVLAARTAGVTTPTSELVGLGLVVLLASAVPLSVAGWGPREGAAAWVFGAAGLGAATGLEVAVVYGVMSLVATLPGILVLRGERRTTRGGIAWASGPTSS